DKPAITAVAVNRESQSDFLKSINAMPNNLVQPMWLDYKRDIQRAKAGPADVLAVQNKENSLFRLYYRYDMGSWNSKLLPVATQYLQFLGTDKMSAEDYSKAFYKLAASYTISPGTDITTVSINGLQENFSKALSLYEDLVANCKPDAKALEGLKGRLKKARDNAKLNKAAIMAGLVSYAQYGEQNPFNNVLSNDELDNLKAEDLVALLHNLLNYKHTVLYYGPQTVTAAATTIAQLHRLPAQFTAYPEAKKFTRSNPEKTRVLFSDFDMVQAEINWVRNESAYDAAKTPTIELYNNYFGGGMSGIVFQTIRESKALAYSTYAYYAAPSKKEDPNYFIAYVGTQADKFSDAIAGMNELLTELPESEKIVTVARQNIRKSLETDRVIQDGILFSYLNAQRHGLDYDDRKNTYASIEKLNYADIKKFHNDEIKSKPFTYCVVASDKRVKDADLKKYGELTKLDAVKLFGY
ncbi:MAG: insulinase family protein, partial [Sphingobacteriaceae bacterium]